MQKHPLLSVKEAAEMLRLDERSVRERLINGQLKGEKKSIGLREKWFVYSGAVDAALAKQQGFVGDPIGLTDITIESEDIENISASEPKSQGANPDDWIQVNRDRVKVLAEEIVKPLMEKIEVQAEVIFEQKRTISDQERQLKLLPDLQKQAEERAKAVELRHVENEALKKQITALEEQRMELEAKAGQATELANDLQALKTKVDELQRPWWKKWFAAGGDQTV